MICQYHLQPFSPTSIPRVLILRHPGRDRHGDIQALLQLSTHLEVCVGFLHFSGKAEAAAAGLEWVRVAQTLSLCFCWY